MKKVLIAMSLLFVLGCSGDDDGANNGLSTIEEIRLVTGISLRSGVNELSIVLGNPNAKSPNLIIFPNPVIDVFSIQSFGLGSISKVVLVKGNTQKIRQDVNFAEALEDVTYDFSLVESLGELVVQDLDSDTVFINVENLSSGYYRVFVEIDNIQYWDNIFIGDGTNNSIEELESFWQ